MKLGNNHIANRRLPRCSTARNTWEIKATIKFFCDIRIQFSQKDLFQNQNLHSINGPSKHAYHEGLLEWLPWLKFSDGLLKLGALQISDNSIDQCSCLLKIHPRETDSAIYQGTKEDRSDVKEWDVESIRTGARSRSWILSWEYNLMM